MSAPSGSASDVTVGDKTTNSSCLKLQREAADTTNMYPDDEPLKFKKQRPSDDEKLYGHTVWRILVDGEHVGMLDTDAPDGQRVYERNYNPIFRREVDWYWEPGFKWRYRPLSLEWECFGDTIDATMQSASRRIRADLAAPPLTDTQKEHRAETMTCVIAETIAKRLGRSTTEGDIRRVLGRLDRATIFEQSRDCDIASNSRYSRPEWLWDLAADAAAKMFPEFGPYDILDGRGNTPPAPAKKPQSIDVITNAFITYMDWLLEEAEEQRYMTSTDIAEFYAEIALDINRPLADIILDKHSERFGSFSRDLSYFPDWLVDEIRKIAEQAYPELVTA